MRKKIQRKSDSGVGGEMRAEPDGIEWYYEPWNPLWNELWGKETLRKVVAGDSRAVELAIDFAIADPFCMGSGYLKSRLFRHLVRASLNPSQRRRLLDGIVESIPVHRGDGWCHYCLLAGKFADAEFLNAARRFLNDTDRAVVRRASHVLIRSLFPGSRPLRNL